MSTARPRAGWIVVRISSLLQRGRPSWIRVWTWPGAPSASVLPSRVHSAASRSFEECVLQLAANGADRVSPFSIVQTLPNLPAGWVSIELGTTGPLLAESTACAASNMAIGDAQGCDPPRSRRRDVLRRHRGADHVGGDGGFRGDARALEAKRRACPCVAAVRRNAGWVRDGRRCRSARAGGVAARDRARGAHLCRGRRLRHFLRRQPRLRHRSDRRESGPRTADGIRGCGRRAGGDRLRQRSRDLDSARRRRGDACPEAGPR